MSDEDFLPEEVVRAQVRVIAGASGRDADDLLACSVGEVLLLTQAYQGAAAAREQTQLEALVKWLNVVAAVAGPIATVAGALAGGIGVASAAKAL